LSEQFLHDVLYKSPRFNEYERGRFPTDRFIGEIYSEAGLQCETEFFRRVFGDIFTPNPPVLAEIPRLATNCQLVLASNTNELHAEDFVPRFQDAFSYFTKLVLSHEIKARKPDADFYEQCQLYANCNPEQCLFIDDRLDNIGAAARHGWKTIHYTDFESLRRGLISAGVYNDV